MSAALLRDVSRCWLLVLLAAMGGKAVAQSAFTLSAPTSAKPGETFYIDVGFRSDGSVAYGLGQVVVPWPLLLAGEGTVYPTDAGVVCRLRFYQRVEVSFFPPAGPGETHLCRIPVTVAPDTVARRYSISAFGSCTSSNDSAVECLRAQIPFLLDGPAPWSQRNLVIVPHAPPAGPPRQVLTAFDYTSSAPAPLQMFDRLRPRNVSGAFEFLPLENAYLKRLDSPNAAVQGLQRGVRATYLSVEEKLRAAADAADDPAVEGVVTSGASYGIRTYPERPRAWEPFALWYVTSVCTQYGWTGYGDLEVSLSAGNIRVDVPERQGPTVDFVCPEGSFNYLWNMPGLPEGSYSLQLAIKGWDTPHYDWPTIPLTIQGAAGGSDPRGVPTASMAWLAMLAVLILGMVGKGARRDHGI